MQFSREFKGIFLASISATFWGVSGAVAQTLFDTTDINSIWLTGIRMLGAGIALLLVSLVTHVDLWSIWRQPRDLLQIGAYTLLGLMPVQFTYFLAVRSEQCGYRYYFTIYGSRVHRIMDVSGPSTITNTSRRAGNCLCLARLIPTGDPWQSEYLSDLRLGINLGIIIWGFVCNQHITPNQVAHQVRSNDRQHMVDVARRNLIQYGSAILVDPYSTDPLKY